MVTQEAPEKIDAAETFAVTVHFNRGADSDTSVPLGPEAFGYLTATSDGEYVFVRSARPGTDIHQAEHNPPWWTLQPEESCF
jgi:hypothetical protein